MHSGTIYEFDASTLETVGTPFKGHTEVTRGLAPPFDHALLASAAEDNTTPSSSGLSSPASSSPPLIRKPDILVLSPDSHQLAYTAYTISYNRNNQKIYICDIPPEVLAQAYDTQKISKAQQQLPAIAFPLTSQILSSTIASRLPQLSPDPRKFLVSSSHTPTVFSARDVESEDLKAMPQDLLKYIVKDGDYPVARSGFGEICRLSVAPSSVAVAVKALHVYADDQLGPVKTTKNQGKCLTEGLSPSLTPQNATS
ncbi:uncharacterized protein EDB93DRAFT_1253125 [Suillus bovinus]|uniref:uncharacterized protein n=1 Tax=Suillus bovinus TaxID=48563 RepID=UPI001B88149C|nr:uncharacterized protein EDB93DRAFT_1253125 [Suillus bovinus]KAG2139194.1 hypothetical protein EDB93DRAFT_1253125 [Suillus bovinus]